MKIPPLTERETEIVLLCAQGHRQESLANQLGARIDTIKAHMYHICKKLEVNSTLEVVVWYYRNNWTPKDGVLTGDAFRARIQLMESQLREMREAVR